jgi:hypothetical protein
MSLTVVSISDGVTHQVHESESGIIDSYFFDNVLQTYGEVVGVTMTFFDGGGVKQLNTNIPLPKHASIINNSGKVLKLLISHTK